jgi:hypothetical protein
VRDAAATSPEIGSAAAPRRELRRRTLSCCSGRHFARAWALRIAGEHASKARGSGGGAGLTGGRHRKGAARLLRRARGGDAACKLKGNWVGVFAHRAQRKKAGSRAERRRQRRGSTTTRLGRRSGELGARLPRASGTKTCDSTSSLSSWRSQKSKRTSEGSNPSPAATDRWRRREPEAAV